MARYCVSVLFTIEADSADDALARAVEIGDDLNDEEGLSCSVYEDVEPATDDPEEDGDNDG